LQCEMRHERIRAANLPLQEVPQTMLALLGILLELTPSYRPRYA
jgi:hypothetical protein